MGVAYIHFYPPPHQEVQHCSSNGQLTISCHIFYSVYNKWHQDNTSRGHNGL